MSNNESFITNDTTTPSPVLIVETTKFYTSTNMIISTNINVSNLKNITSAPQIDNNYIKIHQYEYEKAFSVLIFILIFFLSIICIYWVTKFKLYEPSLDAHHPLLILISYILVLPWLFMDSISAMYLYTHQQDRASIQGSEQSTYTNHSLPIIFSINTDYALHFLFWLSYWCFLQLKMFKIWILRYKLEYKKHMENFAWKDKFGLKDVQKISFFVKHKSLWRVDREKRVFLIQFIFAVLLMCLQIAIRLSSENNPSSPVSEQIFIWIITVIHFITMLYIGYYIKGIFDETFFKLQSKQLLFVCTFALIVWLIGIIISSAAGTNLDFFWYKSGSLLFWCLWITALCYFETVWIVDQIIGESSPKTKRVQKPTLALSDILKDKEGFETMMRYLLEDNECGNLLCYVELSQFITRWTPDEMQTYANPNDDGMFSTPGGPSGYKYSNYDPLSNVNDMQDVIDVFPYFKNKELWSETSHYQYIMDKYVSKNATIPIDISDEVRQSTGQQSLCEDPEFLLLRIYQLRAEIWSLLKFGFNQFRLTDDYRKLTQIISPKTEHAKSRKNIKKRHKRVNTETIDIQESMQSHLQMKTRYTGTWEDNEDMGLKSNHDEEDEKADELRYTEMTMMDSQKEYNGYVPQREDIRKWLNNIGFGEYYNNFVLSGYVSLDMIKQITDWEHLAEIGINKTGDAANVLLEIKRLKGNDRLEDVAELNDEEEKNSLEYKTGWNENNEESDGMIEKDDTSVEDIGMVVVTKGDYSKVNVVARKEEAVEYVDPNEKTPYI